MSRLREHAEDVAMAVIVASSVCCAFIAAICMPVALVWFMVLLVRFVLTGR